VDPPPSSVVTNSDSNALSEEFEISPAQEQMLAREKAAEKVRFDLQNIIRIIFERFRVCSRACLDKFRLRDGQQTRNYQK
jgi:hypothetical protein